MKTGYIVADVPGYISWQSKPALMPVALGHRFEKILIKLSLILQGPPPAIEIHVVGMNVHLRHAAVLGHPIKLAFPYVNRGYFKHKGQGRIMWHRVWKFH